MRTSSGASCERALERILGGLEIPDVLMEVRQRQLRTERLRIEPHGRRERFFRFLLIPTRKLKRAEIDLSACPFRIHGDRSLGNLHSAGQVAETGERVAEQNERFEV